MFAIIRTGGRQYRVKADQVVKVGNLDHQEGDQVVFDDVLMVGGDKPAIGSPKVEGACVAARVVSQQRDAKVIAFKKRRRKHSQRLRGHRQQVTLVTIDGIFVDGAKPVFKGPAAAKPKAAKKTARPDTKTEENTEG